MDVDHEVTIPTRRELLARAAGLHPLLREHAGAADVNRRPADEVVEAMTAAGFFRMFTPARFGGWQVDLRTMYEVCEAVAIADASAGWLLGIGAIGAHAVARGSEKLQREVFGRTPDVYMAGGLAVVPARRVEGGIRMSGRWGYASGFAHATWAALSATVVDEGAGRATVRLRGRRRVGSVRPPSLYARRRRPRQVQGNVRVRIS